MLVELIFDGERYVLSETALGSGNRLLRFKSGGPELAHALFEAELACVGDTGDWSSRHTSLRT